MIKKIILILCILFFFLFLNSIDSQEIFHEKEDISSILLYDLLTFGGQNEDVGYCIKQTSDNASSVTVQVIFTNPS